MRGLAGNQYQLDCLRICGYQADIRFGKTTTGGTHSDSYQLALDN